MLKTKKELSDCVNEEMNIILEQEEIEIILEKESIDEVNILLEKQESQDIVIRNYETLENLPSINGVMLKKDKTFNDLGVINLSNIEIEKLINNIVL